MTRTRKGTATSKPTSSPGTSGPRVKYTLDTLPSELRKYINLLDLRGNFVRYWHQRYRLFSQYDEGVWMDEEAWYSVTPEGIARHLARFIASKCPRGTIIDAFCGVYLSTKGS